MANQFDVTGMRRLCPPPPQQDLWQMAVDSWSNFDTFKDLVNKYSAAQAHKHGVNWQPSLGWALKILGSSELPPGMADGKCLDGTGPVGLNTVPVPRFWKDCMCLPRPILMVLKELRICPHYGGAEFVTLGFHSGKFRSKFLKAIMGEDSTSLVEERLARANCAVFLLDSALDTTMLQKPSAQSLDDPSCSPHHRKLVAPDPSGFQKPCASTVSLLNTLSSKTWISFFLNSLLTLDPLFLGLWGSLGP